MVIGITGGVGSGKSTVVDYVVKATNADVILTDDLAKELTKPGKDSYIKVIKEFGNDILNDDKTIDRVKLAKIVFNDDKKLKLLNECIHPYVCKYIEEYISHNKDKLIIIESALLFETDIYNLCDETWYICASKENKIERLKASRGYSDEKIEFIMASQKDDNFFKEKSNIVIKNDDIEHMKRDVHLVLRLHSYYKKGFPISHI